MAVDTSDKGLNYYPVFVNDFESDKFQLLEEYMGELAVLKFIRLRSVIYSEGYFLRWDEDSCRLFCKRRSYNIETMNEVIKKCCIIGLVSLEMFEWYGILTSQEIQENYMFVANKRKSPKLIYEYLLLPKDIWEKHKVLSFTIINIKEETLDKAKLLPINRPKKKVYTINNNNLFSEIETSDRQQEFDEAIVNHPLLNNNSQKSPTTTTPWEEIVILAATPYCDLSVKISDNISEAYFKSYSRIIERIDNNYSSLHKHNNPITWKEWKFFLKGCPYIEDQVHGGLEKMAASNVAENGTMMAALVRYIKWYIQENEPKLNGVKITSNPNNVPLLTPDYKK
jgi:hypothetical protein